MATKRKAISKTVRFEVFKRDSFSCQYCGKAAPDVILHVDHIHPVSKGGDNDTLNLITSCNDCNSGKSDKTLDDDSAIKKQKAQLDELNERRFQLEMMLKWRKAISDMDSTLIDSFCEEYIDSVPGWSLNETGIAAVKKMLRKHSYNTLIECLHDAASRLEFADGKATQDTASKVLNDCGKIANFKTLPEVEQKLRYIRGIVRNRMYCSENTCIELLREAFSLGASLESLTELAKSARNWTSWRVDIESYIQQYKDAE